jgi:hypothetical protein
LDEKKRLVLDQIQQLASRFNGKLERPAFAIFSD